MPDRTNVLRSTSISGTCRSCGTWFPLIEVDHIVPLWAGGLNDWGNLQPLCERCHNAKTAQELASAQYKDRLAEQRRTRRQRELVFRVKAGFGLGVFIGTIILVLFFLLTG